MKFFTKLRKNEEGATAIEYGLIAALIAVGLITALGNLEGGLSEIFNSVGTRLGTEADEAVD